MPSSTSHAYFDGASATRTNRIGGIFNVLLVKSAPRELAAGLSQPLPYNEQSR